MKTLRIFILLFGWLLISVLPANADELDQLELLGNSSNSTTNDTLESLGEADDTSPGPGDEYDLSNSLPTGLADNTDLGLTEESSNSYSVNGYLKPMLNWNRTAYSDELWTQFQALKADGFSTPDEQEEEKYTYAGIRAQVTLEGYLGSKARLFSSFNLDYNTANTSDADDSDSIAETNKESQQGSIRVVEAFVELYEGSRTWKAGSQLVTWSFMEGYEVPTDRLNARDNSYISSEYEDTKMPSTGMQITQEISASALEIYYIPIGKNNISPSFTDYFFPGGQHPRESKAENSKWASRIVGSLWDLDYALSYVDGTDLQADTVLLDSDGNEMDYDESMSITEVLVNMSQYNKAARVYNRVRSAGLDLQLNLGSWIPKVSAVQYLTEDKEGDDPFIKNNWSQVMLGGELKIASATINLYAGQSVIENYQEETPLDLKTNYLNNQRREITNIVSGYIDADFLTGNALKLNLMVAGYWDKEGEPVENKLKTYLKYKITNGLNISFAVSHVDIEKTQLTDYQIEIKYSI